MHWIKAGFVSLALFFSINSYAQCDLVIEGKTDFFICPGSQTALTPEVSGGTGPYVYSWFPSEGLSDARSASPVCSIPGTYVVNISDARGCKAVSVFMVAHHEIISIDLGPDVTICENDTVKFANFHSEGFNDFTWILREGVDTTNPLSPFLTPAKTTTYIVKGVHKSECVSIDTIKISVNHLPEIHVPETLNATRSKEFRVEGIVVTGGRPPYYYNWENSTSEWSTEDRNKFLLTPVISTERSSQYLFQVRDSNACIAEKLIKINVK